MKRFVVIVTQLSRPGGGGNQLLYTVYDGGDSIYKANQIAWKLQQQGQVTYIAPIIEFDIPPTPVAVAKGIAEEEPYNTLEYQESEKWWENRR